MGKSTSRNRRDALGKLQRRIEARHARMRPPQRVWFWEAHHGVQGFLGMGPAMVVGLNPSKPRQRARALPQAVKRQQWPRSETDRFMYRYLSKQGLANAHLTDLIKVRATRTDVPLLFYSPRVSARHRRYFRQELSIVRPRVVVALGQQVLDVLRGWSLVVQDGVNSWILKGSNGHKAAVVLTVHPAATRWPKQTAERRRRFRRDIRRARRLLQKSH